MDNIFIERLWRSLKYEDVYLHAYASVAEARAGIGAWLHFYNEERLHQAHGYRTPPADLRRAMPRGTIGGAERCRFPRSPSQIGKRRNAPRPPHAHWHIYQEGFGD
jgi:hypothetical protein